MGGSAAHRGEDRQGGFRLSAQGILHPLTIFVKHPSDDPAAPLELTPPDLLQLLLESYMLIPHEGRGYAPCSPWGCRCSGPLRRKALRRHNGINLFLAGNKIAATARVTFDESFIDNAIARLLASGAKTSRSNLDRLAIFLMEDDRHIVIQALDLCDSHRLSPRSGARAPWWECGASR